jgi:hypothetical protein
MPCNTMQNVGLERNRREGEGKKGCDLLTCRGLLSCREGMQNCTRGFIYMGQKCAQRQGQISLSQNADTQRSKLRREAVEM